MTYNMMNGLCPDILRGRFMTRSKISSYSVLIYCHKKIIELSMALLALSTSPLEKGKDSSCPLPSSVIADICIRET